VREEVLRPRYSWYTGIIEQAIKSASVTRIEYRARSWIMIQCGLFRTSSTMTHELPTDFSNLALSAF
jgi:hypothetical protein